MRLPTTLVLSFLLLSAVLFVAAEFQKTPAAGSSREQSGIAPSINNIYDPNPQHIWNRLYDALLVRRDQAGVAYGVDGLDPLLWDRTEHLLSGSSHQRALAILDEFLRTDAENQIHDPAKKALLQSKLWAVFDWSAHTSVNHARERRELQVRLAEVLRRLALSASEIKSLPNNYAQAVASGAFAKEYDPANRERVFLPPDLFQAHGPWVCIQGDKGPAAQNHVVSASGRSHFLVFVRLPQGRKATLDYFHTLWDVQQPWVRAEVDSTQGDLNPALPQFPVGTQVALVRQMMLFDRNGGVVPTPITESVQTRVYRTITTRHDINRIDVDWPAGRTEQDFHEVRLSQAQLFAGHAGGLRVIARDETELAVFQTQGGDSFESSAKEHSPAQKPLGERILDRCVACHSAPGINSLHSRRQLLKPNRAQLDPQPPYDSLWWEAGNTIAWKTNHYDWGLLNGYWQARSGSR